MADIEQTLDASGLNCPLPILRAKKALNDMESGQRLRVVTTDPRSYDDFKAFSKQSGHILEECREEADHYYFLLLKS